ncbi:glycosyltransferase family 2 protein [Methylomonas sp. SURF-2]|uniref:Glycosyltransferase family 2 protein n=1 Tax=Methylomonas subterranea TaxID=2952225 RepID=A0ABT1TCA1_9GAMM|nr:glycosyltransferase family 2 protein [Methylomonas sp. SURF-2]MCQ8103087.1 glycosyltransferase family 2 protein [Methylomonas sp. SURF-2]
MTSLRNISVLLSTYNGSRYLNYQLDSLINQTYPDLNILVRDDGSTDSTLEILKAEKAKTKLDVLGNHNNLGVTGSFFELLRHAASTDTEYVAFCDQDDVWLPTKIEAAISALSSFSDTPSLYCSRQEFVDEHLNHLGFSSIPKKMGFGNALFENIAVGCTMVLNRKAVDLLCKQRLPNEVYVHDWWCFLVLSCFGKIIFDDRALIKYRQHSGNAIGASSSYLGILKRKLDRLFNGKLWISEQATVFYSLFADRLSPNDRTLVELLLKAKSSFWHRLVLAFSRNIWRQKFLDNLILRLVILLNRF